jgi:hypothetical protein
MARSLLHSRTLLIVATIAVLAGCATRPAAGPIPPESHLLTDYTTWFAADVAANRPLIRSILSELEDDMGDVADRTDRIVGGMRITPRLVPLGPPQMSREFSAVAVGRFPPGAVQAALRADRSFERVVTRADGRSGVYFQHRDGPLQLSVPARDLMYLSTGRMLEMFAERPPAELELDPDIYRTLRTVGHPGEPAAVIIFSDPGVELLSSLGVDAPALPLTRIGLSLWNRDDRLELGGSLVLRSERDAALFGRISRLFIVIFVRALGLESAAAQQAMVQVDGATVRFSGIPIESDEIVDLVRLLGNMP